MSSPTPTIHSAEHHDEEKGRPDSDTLTAGSSPHTPEKARSVELPSGEDIEVKLDDSENPHNWSTIKKWRILLIICSGATLTTCASSMVR